MGVVYLNFNAYYAAMNARGSKNLDGKIAPAEMARVIAVAWKTGLLSQKETCADLRMNQGQFSRLVNGKFVRPSGRAKQLFEYAKSRLERGAQDKTGVARLKSDLLVALMSAWDGSPSGALALCDILRGAKNLRPPAK